MNKTISNFFGKNGYCIINLFNNKSIEKFKSEIADKLNLLGKDLRVGFRGNNLKNYHKLKLTEGEHIQILKAATRYIFLGNKIKKNIIENDKIINVLKSNWGHSDTLIRWIGSLQEGSIKKNATGFRIARPKLNKSRDVGGVHYDLPYGRGQKPNKDHKALMTIWCPLVGFSEKYSLKIYPKSHLFKHPISSILNQKKYLSPVFKKNYIKKFEFIRPRLKKGQAIMFHPNLMHGSSYNKGKKTRLSIDLRIFNKKKVKL